MPVFTLYAILATDVRRVQPRSLLDQIYEGSDATADTERGMLSVFQAAGVAAENNGQAISRNGSHASRDRDCRNSKVEMNDFEDYIWEELDDEQCTGAGFDAVIQAEKTTQGSDNAQWSGKMPPTDVRLSNREQEPLGKVLRVPPTSHEGHVSSKLPAELTIHSSKLPSSYSQSCSFFTAGSVK